MRLGIAGILEGGSPIAGPEEALADLKVMLTIMKAGVTRQWEYVADLEPNACCGSLLFGDGGADGSGKRPACSSL